MNKNLRRGMSKFLSMAFAMSIVLGGASKVKAADNSLNLDDAQVQKIKEQLYELAVNQNKDKKVETEYKDLEEVVRVVVQLIGKSASENSESQATPQAISAVKAAQGAIKAQASVLDGAKIRHSYGNVVNGFSMDVKRKEIDRLRQLPGVKSVKEANKYEADMNNAKNLTQALEAWSKYNLKGEGMLVSIVDTGVDYRHKDMIDPKDTSKLKLTKGKIEELTKSGVLKADKDAETYFRDKVPFGYNYADKNNDIIDRRPDGGHGIHVAGIVGANGDEEQVKNGQAVQGVAPEAQLLAMKAFSNGPAGKYAYTDDIVAAIEDSVTLGADVINMSLGSPAGFQDDEDAEQKAIKNATDKGVTVVVSAGNSSYSTAPYRDSTMKDISTVGSPALAKDALMVANYQNEKVTSYAATFIDGAGVKLNTPYTNHTFSFEEKKEFDLVYCGKGKPEEFNGKDLKGKVALIERGDLTFVDKIKNAQAVGAVGVVVYNHTTGGDALMNMATDPAVAIPAIFVGHSSGQSMADKLTKNEVVKLMLSGATISGENPEANDYDDSTSWGAAPNLDFKPQIAGPGGNIFSTVNDNKYENMSGTSMAAPHVSGGMALILEAIKGYNKTLQGRDLVNYAKNIAMNTSSIKMDKTNTEVPFSPRRQGSGLIQIADAIRNKVTATYNGTAAVALKEIKDKKVTFAIDLNNYGDKDVTYALENFKGVLSQEDKDAVGNMARDIVLPADKANISFDVSEVTVRAGSSAKVNVTLNVGVDFKTENFLEGYIKFNSKDNENPSLVVPFMGYYGDWTKERIINYASWEKADTLMALLDKNGQLKESPALTSKAVAFDDKGKGSFLGYDDSNFIAISPNDDKNYDELIPYLYMLRNAKKVTAEVLDDKENVLFKAGEDENVRKQIYNSSNGSGKAPSLRNSLKWDGKIYNQSTGKYEVAKEGQYTLNIKSYVDLQDAKPQEFKIPVKIDVTAPEFQIVSSDKSETTAYTLKWKQKDNLSGFGVTGVMINGKVVAAGDAIKYDKDTEVYSADVTLDENAVTEVVIAGFDNANNFGMSKISVQQGKIAPTNISFDSEDFAGANMELTEKGLTDEGTYKVTGKLTSPLKVFKIGKKDVTINKDLTFAVELDAKEFKQGLNYIPVYAENYDGSIAKVGDISANYSVKLYFDSEAPVINLAQPLLDKEGNALVNKDEVTLKGVVSDSAMGYTFYINGEKIHKVEKEVNYGYEATAYNFEKTILVKTGDVLELKAVDLFGHETVKNIKVTVDKEAPTVTVTGVENDKVYNTSVTPVVNVNDKEATVETTLNGKAYDGKEISEEGKYELVAIVTDKAGNKSEVVVNFAIDKTAPNVTVTGIENGKVYDKEVTPEITVDDKDATLKFMLNGKEYDGKTAIKEEGKYKLEIVATDKAGNAKETTIEFEIKLPSEDKNEEKPADNQNQGNNNGTTNTTTNTTTTDKLAKTGSLVSGNLLMSLGATLMGLGAAVFSSKKRKEE